MEWESFKSLVEHVTSANASLMAFCTCRITYSGRAEAELDWGERMVVIKQDNTLLIHQPINGNPINYLKAGSKITAHIEKEALILEAENTTTKDYIYVEIQEVHDAMHKRLEDGKKQVLAGTEAEMSDMIRDNPEVISKDFTPLSREEHTKYGFIDVFGHDKNGTLVVVECKRYSASLACVTQLRRYVERIKELKGIDTVLGVMASPKITTNAQKMLEDWGFEWARVIPPKRLERHRRGQKTLESW
jgi:RecB family endonuclease NucS